MKNKPSTIDNLYVRGGLCNQDYIDGLDERSVFATLDRTEVQR